MSKYTEKELLKRKDFSCYSLKWPPELIKKYPQKFDIVMLVERIVKELPLEKIPDYLESIYDKNGRGFRMCISLEKELRRKFTSENRYTFFNFTPITEKILELILKENGEITYEKVPGLSTPHFSENAGTGLDFNSLFLTFNRLLDIDFIKKYFPLFGNTEIYFLFLMLGRELNEENIEWVISTAINQNNCERTDVFKSAALNANLTERIFWDYLDDFIPHLPELINRKDGLTKSWSSDFQLLVKLKDGFKNEN